MGSCSRLGCSTIQQSLRLRPSTTDGCTGAQLTKLNIGSLFGISSIGIYYTDITRQNIAKSVYATSMARVKLDGFLCERCKHTWVPRNKDKDPTVCPECKSPYWNRPRGGITGNHEKVAVNGNKAKQSENRRGRAA